LNSMPTRTCASCTAGCSTCTSSSEYACTSCILPAMFLSGRCVTECPQSFVSD
jgi:hypothetical protein